MRLFCTAEMTELFWMALSNLDEMLVFEVMIVISFYIIMC